MVATSLPFYPVHQFLSTEDRGGLVCTVSEGDVANNTKSKEEHEPSASVGAQAGTVSEKQVTESPSHVTEVAVTEPLQEGGGIEDTGGGTGGVTLAERRPAYDALSGEVGRGTRPTNPSGLVR